MIRVVEGVLDVVYATELYNKLIDLPDQRTSLDTWKDYLTDSKKAPAILLNDLDSVDQDKVLSSKSQNFINKYSLNTINHTSNINGERITVPRIDSTNKSLIAGDSVALGLMLNDDQTLSSKLQQNNNTVQYINLGISNASSFDNLFFKTKLLIVFIFINKIIALKLYSTK